MSIQQTENRLHVGKFTVSPLKTYKGGVTEHTIATAERGAEMLARGDDFAEAAAIRELIKAVRDGAA